MMDDPKFDALARAALAPEEGPNERVWQQIRPVAKDPVWLPSFREIAFATAVGVGVLIMMGQHEKAPIMARHTPRPKPSADRTYVAINAMTFP